MSGASFAPRLNHIAITLQPDVLDERGRRDLLDFYGAVFGWTEGDASDEPGDPLILYTNEPGQFVYLLPGEPHLVAPAIDHFGMQVATLSELTAIVTRARDYRKHDERVRIVDVTSRVTRGPTHDYTLTSAYVRFLLPLMIELQHLERHAEPRA